MWLAPLRRMRFEFRTPKDRHPAQPCAPLDPSRRRLAADGVPEQVEHSRENLLANRCLQLPARVFHRVAAGEALSGDERDCALAMRIELSQYLNGSLSIHRVKQLVDRRQVSLEMSISDTAAH